MIAVASIINKVKQYCTFQDRSHQEVKEKLYALGLHKQQVEELLAQLIEEDYLNEERFATQFARGKFRIKNWGRIKIKYELKQKRVSIYNINKAMEEIDETDYIKTLHKLAKKKWLLIKEGNLMMRKAKTVQYLLQKGYERFLAMQAVDVLANETKEK